MTLSTDEINLIIEYKRSHGFNGTADLLQTLVTERDQLLQKLELAHAELAKYRAREVDL